MRSKFALAVAVLGLLLLALGIGQRTLWAPPETLTATVAAGSKSAPVTVLTPALLKDHSGPVSLTIKSSGPIVLAAGRSDDVAAWVGKAAHLSVTGADADYKDLATSFTAGEATVPNPAGSDLWTLEQSGSKELHYTWDSSAGNDTSLLLASDGTAPAPTDISATVANDTATPWAVPLMVLGSLLLVAGLLVFFIKPKRSSGRRGGPPARPLARNSGRPVQGNTVQRPGSVPEGNAPRLAHRLPVRARLAAGTAVALSAALGAAGVQTAQADTASPSSSASASPSASASAAAADTAPVVNDAQFNRILDAVAKVAAAGDAAKDAKELAGRFDGSALALRTGNYKVRSQVADYEAVVPVTSTKLLTKTISTNRAWPRTFVAVTQGPDNKVPQILTLVQNTPRENYKLISATGLLPGQTLPLADKNGAPTLAPGDKSGLQYSTTEALAAVTDRLGKADSVWKDKIPDNAYLTDTLAYEAKSVTDSPDAALVFSHTVVGGSVHTFRVSDGGALVMANLAFTITATPKTDGVTLSFVKNDAPVFTGGKDTKTGYELNYTEPVVVYIPAEKASTKLTLLAANRGLTGASFK
ncbi:MAG: hypothetical protein ACHP7K_03470 [Actinomycetales bacterium]